jgi:hypothetical protein
LAEFHTIQQNICQCLRSGAEIKSGHFDKPQQGTPHHFSISVAAIIGTVVHVTIE